MANADQEVIDILDNYEVMDDLATGDSGMLTVRDSEGSPIGRAFPVHSGQPDRAWGFFRLDDDGDSYIPFLNLGDLRRFLEERYGATI